MNVLRNIFYTLSTLPRTSLFAVGVFCALGVLAPFLTPYDPSAQDLLSAHQGSSPEHWLGTDHLGRDTFSRLIASARTSLVGMALVLGFALTVGISIGTLAGYRRGWVEESLMRIVDVGMAVPSLIIALATIGIFGTGYWNMILALAIAWWPGSARISRAVAVNVMNRPHIEALRVLGASPFRIYFRHLLPATLGAVLVYATADAGSVALAIATLSFLGLGVQPPTAEWGQMLVDGLPYLETYPREVILPGLALTAVVIGFNMLGESIALNRVPKTLGRKVLRNRRAISQAWAEAGKT
jgi:peptide/nickel transport system permease protein